MSQRKKSSRGRDVRLDKPQGTVVGDFASVVNNFFRDPNAGYYSVAILLVLALILGSLWYLVFRAPGGIVQVQILPTSTITPVPTITPTPTAVPFYSIGLVTFLQKEAGADALYALNRIGERVLLLKISGDSDLSILAISPEQENGLRYLAIRYQVDQKSTLVVVSSDGQQVRTLSQGNAPGKALYLPNGDLLAEIHEAAGIRYKRFSVDGSHPVDIYPAQSTPTP